MPLSDDLPPGILTMGLTPGFENHLVHTSPALAGGSAFSAAAAAAASAVSAAAGAGAGPAGAGSAGTGAGLGGYLLLKPPLNASAMGMGVGVGVTGGSLPTNAANVSTAAALSAISHAYTLPWMVAVAVLLFLLVLVTMFGNFLVILAVFRYQKLRSVSNYLIGNLAMSDFLLSVTILPMSVVNQCLGYWVFGEILCKFWLVADVLYCTASIWNLCIIAFDRFTATLYPMWYREKRTLKQGVIYIAIVWVLSFGICVPPLLGWNDFTKTYMHSNETDTYSCLLFTSKGYVMYSASGSFYIPFLITVFMYIRIFGVLHKRIRKMRAAATRRAKQAKGANRALPLPPPPSRGGATGLPGNAASQAAAMMTTTTTTLMTGSNAETDHREEAPRDVEPGAGSADGREGPGAAAVPVQAEEHSSRSLFGSDSQGDNRSDDEDSAQARSDHPLYVSSSEAEVITKNGVRPSLVGQPLDTTPEVRRALTRSNNAGADPLEEDGGGDDVDSGGKYESSHTRLASDDSEKDSENVQIVVTEDSGTIMPNNNRLCAKPLKANHGRLKSRLLSVSKEVLHRSDSPSEKNLVPRHSIANPLKHVNPFKKDREKARSSSTKQKRFDQREVRATVRMAIIIAFFCGCWLGFFIIYVVRAFCNVRCIIPTTLDNFLFWLGYSNSAMNPILYTIFNDDFRKAFQKLLGCHVRSAGGSTSGRSKH